MPSFDNDHFEIESTMILHLYKVLAAKIRMKVSDPDTILVYTLYHMLFWPIEREISIETMDKHRNQTQLINVRQIFNSFTPACINALPAWYSFTGCKYEPSFHRKGRKTCWNVLEKNIEFQLAFGNDGSDTDVKSEDIATVEKYACKLYNAKSKDVNGARVEIFQNAYGCTKADHFSCKPKPQKLLL